MQLQQRGPVKGFCGQAQLVLFFSNINYCGFGGLVANACPSCPVVVCFPLFLGKLFSQLNSTKQVDALVFPLEIHGASELRLPHDLRPRLSADGPRLQRPPEGAHGGDHRAGGQATLRPRGDPVTE